MLDQDAPSATRWTDKKFARLESGCTLSSCSVPPCHIARVGSSPMSDDTEWYSPKPQAASPEDRHGSRRSLVDDHCQSHCMVV
jgi:hypothetical protein